jgi:hypothetical protein
MNYRPRKVIKELFMNVLAEDAQTISTTKAKMISK